MKCFIGLPAAAEIIPYLLALQRKASALDIAARPVPKENFHLTLAFIGEVTPKEAFEIAKGVEIMTDFAGERWMIDRSGVFLRPKVCWVGGERFEPLELLAREARMILNTLRVPFDRGAFRAHVTLLRNSRLDSPLVTEPFAWPILKPRLFESKLNEAGRRVYEPVRA